MTAVPKPPPGDWVELANCVGVDPELFFPERFDGHVVARQAAQVCAACSVRAECLAYAQSYPQERWGVWGGQTFAARRRSRKAAS